MSDHNGDYNYDELHAPSQSSQTQRQQQEEPTMNPISLSALPDIPSSDLDLGSIIAPSELDSPTPQQSAKVQKRASNVLKLSLEHQKLEEELRAMNERLKALEQAASQRGTHSISNRA